MGQNLVNQLQFQLLSLTKSCQDCTLDEHLIIRVIKQTPCHKGTSQIITYKPFLFKSLIDLIIYLKEGFNKTWVTPLPLYCLYDCHRPEEDHVGHVQQVLQWLFQHQLFVKAKKCVFNQTTVSSLGFITSSGGSRLIWRRRMQYASRALPTFTVGSIGISARPSPCYMCSPPQIPCSPGHPRPRQPSRPYYLSSPPRLFCICLSQNNSSLRWTPLRWGLELFSPSTSWRQKGPFVCLLFLETLHCQAWLWCRNE